MPNLIKASTDFAVEPKALYSTTYYLFINLTILIDFMFIWGLSKGVNKFYQYIEC